MGRPLRALGIMVFLALLLVVGSLAYSTMRGYTTWYFRVNGQVVVNGRPTTGYLHANTRKTLLLLTRTDDSRPETYLVSLESHKAVVDCGEWHPLRFLPTPVGDLSPPCSFFADPKTIHDPIMSASLTTGRNFVEFSTTSGSKVRGQW